MTESTSMPLYDKPSVVGVTAAAAHMHGTEALLRRTCAATDALHVPVLVVLAVVLHNCYFLLVPVFVMFVSLATLPAICLNVF